MTFTLITPEGKAHQIDVSEAGAIWTEPPDKAIIIFNKNDNSKIMDVICHLSDIYRRAQ